MSRTGATWSLENHHGRRRLQTVGHDPADGPGRRTEPSSSLPAYGERAYVFQPCLRVISSSRIIRPSHKIAGKCCAWPLSLPEARTPLPPALFSRLQSHRNGFLKTQGISQENRRQNQDALWQAIGKGIDLFTLPRCQNYFSAAGYNLK